ncbi:hypothetical protein L2E82_14196 [Cichorium intybus]|uniref:Uncharacterized protein n=1 Tax=Cichorium intybus TaxID=13427 RepID=A0ACB9F051_CICIN|nr:hypothetical protein L2E82_14196 [Cichorium intybus]
MPPTYFPLRWESTGDQWWYASPIDWAAANGHYDLVCELLRLDSNHLIKLPSLWRIRRLEVVWDDEEQFDDVAKNLGNAAVQRKRQHVVSVAKERREAMFTVKCSPSPTKHEICGRCVMQIPGDCLGCQMFTVGGREETRRRKKKV